MRVTVLGCGTSSGVPRIGGDWGACDPMDRRNRRTRAALLVESDAVSILVDTGPDMRDQLLAADVRNVDAVIWTHEHADHSHGIDDLRQLYHLRGSPIDGYARPGTLALLERRFRYIFHGRDGYPPVARLHTLRDRMVIGDVEVRVTDQPHGSITSAGLRFDNGGLSVGYATDFSNFTPDMMMLFSGLDVLIVDALRKTPHPTHAHVSLVLDALRQLAPKRAVLTHMDQSMDYATIAAELPRGVEPGIDNLRITLT